MGTVIKVNAITVPEDSGDELAERFAARAGAVDDQDGFEGFELLKPTDGRNQWLVVTRWRDEGAFEAWVSGPSFAHGHAGATKPASHGGPVSVSAVGTTCGSRSTSTQVGRWSLAAARSSTQTRPSRSPISWPKAGSVAGRYFSSSNDRTI